MLTGHVLFSVNSQPIDLLHSKIINYNSLTSSSSYKKIKSGYYSATSKSTISAKSVTTPLKLLTTVLKDL